MIWASDGGAEASIHGGAPPEPWRGSYDTAMEGGMRTPFMIRWPGRIPPSCLDGIVHGTDVFTTIAGAVQRSGAIGPCDQRRQ